MGVYDNLQENLRRNYCSIIKSIKDLKKKALRYYNGFLIGKKNLKMQNFKKEV